MNDSYDERTLPASPQRRAEAWRNGPTPRSRPLGTAAVLLTTVMYGAFYGGNLVVQSAGWLQMRLLDTAAAGVSGDDLIQNVRQSLWAGIALAGGLVLTSLSAALAIELLQSGLRLAPHQLAPDPMRLTAAGSQNLGRGLSPASLTGEAVRWLLPLVLLACLLLERGAELRALLVEGPAAMAQLAGELTSSLVWRVCGVLFVCGLAHYAWVRIRWERGLRMTPTEQREEQRREGGRRTG